MKDHSLTKLISCLILFAFLSSLSVYCQDTIYYDQFRKPTSNKDSIRFTSIQYNWKTIRFSEIDTITIEILNDSITLSDKQKKIKGSFRHIKLKYGSLSEEYLPIGRHFNYRRKGKIKTVQNYSRSGFLLSDTTYRRNGKVKLTRLYQAELSRIQSNGKELYFNDRFFYITFYFRNGGKDCEGLGESERNIWLHRRDTWKFYHKDGRFKYELKYKST